MTAPAKSRSTKKGVADVPATADVSPVTPPPPVAEAAPADVEEVQPAGSEAAVDGFSVLTEKLNTAVTELKSLLVVVKGLQKEHAKLKKLTTKKSKSRKGDAEGGAPRVQSGFAKPTLLSDALCNFLGVPSGTMLARTEVTRKINEYIKEHKLQTDADRRVIVPDEKLKAILDIKEGVPLSFFNLQGCLKNHFLKASA